MPNARPNVPDHTHRENLREIEKLRTEGFVIEFDSQGYRVVDPKGKFLGAAGTLKKPHGRYREANTRDNALVALITTRQKPKE